jgi:LCP family protein required for cell wall assembly
MQQNRRKGTGMKIFLGVFVVLLIGVFGYVYSVYHNVKSTMDTVYTPVETETYREGVAGSVDESVAADAGTAEPAVAEDASLANESTETAQTSGTAIDAMSPSELLEAGEPVSILLLGVDTGALGRTEKGRTDSMVIVTVNPHTEQTTLVSIPRDTYAEIVGYGTWDKINHAYNFGGTAMSINSVQSLLDIPVDFYVIVNMSGIKEVVDAVGGVDVDSPIAFNQNGYSFVVGTNHLDGEAALAFSRMRQKDPEQDTGRQGRQRLVIEEVLRKIATPETLMNYQAILNSLSTNVQTSFQLSDFLALQSSDYLGAVNNIQQEQLGGTGDMMGGVYYNFVEDAELARVQSLLKAELELD